MISGGTQGGGTRPLWKRVRLPPKMGRSSCHLTSAFQEFGEATSICICMYYIHIIYIYTFKITCQMVLSENRVPHSIQWFVISFPIGIPTYGNPVFFRANPSIILLATVSIRLTPIICHYLPSAPWNIQPSGWFHTFLVQSTFSSVSPWNSWSSPHRLLDESQKTSVSEYPLILIMLGYIPIIFPNLTIKLIKPIDTVRCKTHIWLLKSPICLIKTIVFNNFESQML